MSFQDVATGQPLRAGARITGNAIMAMKEKVRGQTKREKEVVQAIRFADVAVLFNSAKQFHTLNSKFLEDLELRLSAAVEATANAFEKRFSAPDGDTAGVKLASSLVVFVCVYRAQFLSLFLHKPLCLSLCACCCTVVHGCAHVWLPLVTQVRRRRRC